MGQCCPVKCTAFPSESHNSTLWWALNSTPATAENWLLKEGMLKVKHYTCTMLFKHIFQHLLTAGVRILEKIVSIVFDRNKSCMFLTLILLTWRMWWAPNNASKWQMGFNSVFKGLKTVLNTTYVQAFMWEKKVIDLVSQTFEIYCTTVCTYLKKNLTTSIVLNTPDMHSCKTNKNDEHIKTN